MSEILLSYFLTQVIHVSDSHSATHYSEGHQIRSASDTMATEVTAGDHLIPIVKPERRILNTPTNCNIPGAPRVYFTLTHITLVINQLLLFLVVNEEGIINL